MRNVWRSGAMTLAMLAAVPASAAVPDRGGLTFDFPAVSARHYAWNAADGTNLVRGSREGTSGRRNLRSSIASAARIWAGQPRRTAAIRNGIRPLGGTTCRSFERKESQT